MEEPVEYRIGYNLPSLQCQGRGHFHTQLMWSCMQCRNHPEICEACARTCHRGHKVQRLGVKLAKCDCSKAGTCIFHGMHIHEKAVGTKRQWVCVSQPGQQNRVFVADQISDLTAKELSKEILNLPPTKQLWVLDRNCLWSIPSKCIILQEYPNIPMKEKPDEYAFVSSGLVIDDPRDDGDIILLVTVCFNGGEKFPALKIGVSRSEISHLSGRVVLDRCKLAFPKECPIGECELYCGERRIDRMDNIWSVIETGDTVYCRVLSNSPYALLPVVGQALIDLESKIIQELNDLKTQFGADKNNNGDILAMYKNHQLLKMSLTAELQMTSQSMCLGMVFMTHFPLEVDRALVNGTGGMYSILEACKGSRAAQLRNAYVRSDGEKTETGEYFELLTKLEQVTPKWSHDQPFISAALRQLKRFWMESRVKALEWFSSVSTLKWIEGRVPAAIVSMVHDECVQDDPPSSL